MFETVIETWVPPADEARGCDHDAPCSCAWPQVGWSVQEDAARWAERNGWVGPMAATTAVAEAVDRLHGPELAGFLGGLPSAAGVDGWTVIEALKGFEKLQRWAAAEQVRWLGELARRRVEVRTSWARGRDAVSTGLGDDRTPAEALTGRVAADAAAEVAMALDLTTGAAKQQLFEAVVLTRRLPETLTALRLGLISRRTAAMIADETSVLEDDVLADVDGAAAERSAGRTTPAARARVRTLVARSDPRAAAARATRARRGRYFEVQHDVRDGVIGFGGVAAAHDVLAIEARVSELAAAALAASRAAGEHDDRSADARRCDVVVDLLLGRGIGGAAGSRADRGRGWKVDVVVSLETLRGTSEAPAEIPGFGPLDAQSARDLAHDPAAEWRRLVTDPLSGIVLDVGTERYSPPTPLADLVRARDRTCTAPGCRVPAARCDLDHTRNSPAGPSPRPDPDGATSAANLSALCHFHHTHVKAHPDWTVTALAPGHLLWTTPTGHTYQRPPQPALDRLTPDDPVVRPPPYPDPPF